MANDVPGLDPDHARRTAADEVQRLVDELEPTLATRERRLLHQLRLAAETLGALSATSTWPHHPIVGRFGPSR